VSAEVCTSYDILNPLIGYLNDLWRYRINESMWSWIDGSYETSQPGVYGTKGNASTGNYPGARSGAVALYDSLREEVWLFGGVGYTNASSSGE